MVGSVLCMVSGCQQKEEKLTASGFFFDTAITITVHNTTQSVVDEALELCRTYENIFSKTVENSDVWRLNHGEGAITKLHPSTMEVLEKAKVYSQLSLGAFDVTVAPIMSKWDFTSGTNIVPEESVIAELLPLVDYKKLTLSSTNAQLPKGMAIDLGGIAKGYIANKIAEFFVSKGVTSGLLNFGGNVVAIGAKPDGSLWRVGIRDPKGDQGDSIAVIAVEGKSVVTSGIYERGFEKDGVYYHHIIDPHTGWPTQSDLASVTIIADDSADGDALSTACFVLGMDKAAELIQSLPGVDALFINKNDEMHATVGFTEKYSLSLP